MAFYYQVIELKNRIRSGWNEEHWNINAERRESIAEHVFGVCILAISMHSEQKSTVNLDKVLKMLIIHELGEVKIGEILVSGPTVMLGYLDNEKETNDTLEKENNNN